MDVSPLVFDLETAGHPDAPLYWAPVTPDGRLTDPIKIANDIAAKEAQRADRLSLDWNVGRIVALGMWTAESGPEVLISRDEEEERCSLLRFWKLADHRTLVGFAIKQFDLRFLIQRSRLLRIPHLMLELSPYSHRGITDLFLELTFSDGHKDQGAMRRTLKAFAKRFGIPCSDLLDGREIPALVAAGEWEQVAAHCASDLSLTVQLGQRLGYVSSSELAAVL